MWKNTDDMTLVEIEQELNALKQLKQIKNRVNVDKLLYKKEELDCLKILNVTLCPNGSVYTKNFRGFLPNLMEKKYNERAIFKEKMLKAKQQYNDTNDKKYLNESLEYFISQNSRKTALNSAYGAIGNSWFRYYKLENAIAVTSSGQLSIKWISNKLNEYLNKLLKTTDVDFVTYIDTDSVYINLGDLVEKVLPKDTPDEKIVNFLDKVSEEKLKPYIDKCYDELAEYLNAYEQKMEMKRENIANKGIWTGKKHYILNVWDNEGVRNKIPELKMMGIEAIKSSTPTLCRELMKDSIKIIMNGTEDDIIKFVKNSKKRFYNEDLDKISFNRSISDINKWKNTVSLYSKGTPIHVRGAILHNHYLQKYKLDDKYNLLQNGDKLKFCYLKMPNPILENVISFIEFPSELGLNKYIDYDLQFEKGFLKGIEELLNIVGWSYKKRKSLLELFGD